jgi:hypothetical protein
VSAGFCSLSLDSGAEPEGRSPSYRWRVSRGLITLTPTLSRQMPYALHTPDAVTSDDMLGED